jgi:ABC-type antimicrobial peptide transport system permease subunit
LTAEIKHRISQSHPGIGMQFRVFETEIRDSLLRERFLAAVSGFFGALAALLAVVGLYGVIAYIIASRRNEIGIRVALGASRLQVVGLFIGEAGLLIACGILVGLGCAAGLAHGAQSLLFGITAFDIPTYAAASVLLAGVAFLATYFPARRAARLDPMTVLRYE